MTKLPVLMREKTNGPPEAVRIIHPDSGSMTLNKVPLSTATLTLKQDEMIPPRSWVQMFSPNGPEGVYRVRSATGGYGEEQTSTVELEHAITEVGDYLVTADAEQETTLAAGLRSIFSSYRGRYWTLGQIAAPDRVILNTGHETVLEAMISLMEQAPSYLFTFNFTTFPWTLGVRKKDSTVTAEGRLSRNIAGANVTYDETDLCTRAIVEYNKGSGQTDTLTIEADTIGQYGVKEAYLSGGYTQAEASIVGNAYIAAHKHPTVAVEISGIDLSRTTGEELDTFLIGKLYRLAIPAYGVTVEQEITSITWDDLYGNPKSVSISLAEAEDPVIRFLKKQQRTSKGNAKVTVKQNKEFWTKISQTDTDIDLIATQQKEEGSILRQAGLHLDVNGVLQYATDYSDPNSKYLGSKFYVQAQAISAEVERATESEGILSGRLAVTAEAVEAEVTRATGEEGRISGRVAVNANKVAIVVEEKNGQYVIKAASIVTAINDGESSILIDADHVRITGNTTVSGAFTIEDGSLVVKKSAVFQGNINLTTAGSYIQAPTYSVPSAGKIQFVGTGSGENYSLTTTILKGMIKSFSVSGNTLTLTPFYGEPVNFNKAVPVVTLTGSWNGRTFTVMDTSGSGESYSETPTYETGTGYGQNDSITVNSFDSSHIAHARVKSSSGQGGNVLFGFKVDASGQYSDGQTNGRNGVNIVKGSWSNAQVEFTKSAGSANTKGVKVGSSGTWSSGNFTAPIKDYYDDASGVDTGYSVTTSIGTPSTSNPTAQPSSASITGRTQVGTNELSKATLSGPGYIFFSITVRGKELKYYIKLKA